VILAGLLLVFLHIQKKKNRASLYVDHSWSEKLTDPTARPYSITPSEPVSSHDFTREPMDAANSLTHYSIDDPFVAQPAAGSASLPDLAYNYARDVNNQYPYYGDESNNVTLLGARSTPALMSKNLFEPAQSQNPFESVSGPRMTDSSVHRSSRRQEVSPSLEPALRDSGAYRRSLDSFYNPSVSDSGRHF